MCTRACDAELAGRVYLEQTIDSARGHLSDASGPNDAYLMQSTVQTACFFAIGVVTDMECPGTQVPDSQRVSDSPVEPKQHNVHRHHATGCQMLEALQTYKYYHHAMAAAACCNTPVPWAFL